MVAAADAEAAVLQVLAPEVRRRRAVLQAQRAAARQAPARLVPAALVRGERAAVAATRHHHVRRTATC